MQFGSWNDPCDPICSKPQLYSTAGVHPHDSQNSTMDNVILPGMEAIPDDRDNVRLMLGQRFAQVSIKLTVLVQIRRR